MDFYILSICFIISIIIAFTEAIKSDKKNIAKRKQNKEIKNKRKYTNINIE